MLPDVERVLFLKRVGLFADIPGEDLTHLARVAIEESFEPDEKIFAEGDSGDSLYLIIRGRVRIHRGDRLVTDLGASECFGEMAILDNEVRSASATTVEDTTCLQLLREDFDEILGEKPALAFGIIRVLTKRLRKAIK